MDEYDEEKQSDTTYRIITEMTILTVQLIVEFAKRLPGFDKLVREDQITLLKVKKKKLIITTWYETNETVVTLEPFHIRYISLCVFFYH